MNTIGELRTLIAGLPDDIPVVLGIDPHPAKPEGYEPLIIQSYVAADPIRVVILVQS